MTQETPTTKPVIHPARFNAPILGEIESLLDAYGFSGVILDPFAGTGGVHQLASDRRTTIGIEIEPEWAASHPETIVGNALALDLADESVDAIVTSPCYGNRLADHHTARDGSYRRSYTHDLRRMTGDLDRELRTDNAGRLQWGSEYRLFHERAWTEVCRVLRPSGLFLLNVSDHVRDGSVVPVADWHVQTLRSLDLTLTKREHVPTPRMRFGANRRARVESEFVILFSKPGQPTDASKANQRPNE